MKPFETLVKAQRVQIREPFLSGLSEPLHTKRSRLVHQRQRQSGEDIQCRRELQIVSAEPQGNELGRGDAVWGRRSTTVREGQTEAEGGGAHGGQTNETKLFSVITIGRRRTKVRVKQHTLEHRRGGTAEEAVQADRGIPRAQDGQIKKARRNLKVPLVKEVNARVK